MQDHCQNPREQRRIYHIVFEIRNKRGITMEKITMKTAISQEGYVSGEVSFPVRGLTHGHGSVLSAEIVG